MGNNRKQFRQAVFDRDENNCLVPWCDQNADDAHHIIERDLWDDGGYVKDNGASVCNHHHQYAESNDIPPQAFYLWAGINDPPTPNTIDTVHTNKWGEEFDRPPWKNLRERIKYQSSRHLLPLYWHDDETTADSRMEHDDTGLETVEDFTGIPLVITHKIDGSNCMMVGDDLETPVRARNGSSPTEDMERLHGDGGLYWQQEVNQKLPDRLQVFGEWTLAKHSIHYGCNCNPPCEDVGPRLSELTGIENARSYFQIFGVFDKEWDMWLSWNRTEAVADELGFPTTPVIHCEDSNDAATYETEHEARQDLINHAREVIENGGEGIVVRSKFPFHYDQFSNRLGKYVRENHVTTDEHWSHTDITENQI
jgi:hypothetical protein